MGLRVLIESEDDLVLAGEADNGRDAVQLIRRARPDVVLMDIRMPDLDGISALRQVTADPALTGVRVIMLTTFELDEYVFDALQAGAAGFLIKDSEPADMLRAIRLVAARGVAAVAVGDPAGDRVVHLPVGAAPAAPPVGRADRA